MCRLWATLDKFDHVPLRILYAKTFAAIFPLGDCFRNSDTMLRQIKSHHFGIGSCKRDISKGVLIGALGRQHFHPLPRHSIETRSTRGFDGRYH